MKDAAILNVLDAYTDSIRAIAVIQHKGLWATYSGYNLDHWYDVCEKTTDELYQAIDNYKNNNNPVTNLESRITSLEGAVARLIGEKRYQVDQTIYGSPLPNPINQLELFNPDFARTLNSQSLAKSMNSPSLGATNPVGVGFAK